MGEYIRENIDWNDFTKYIQTETSTASVRFYMFMGGTRDKNAGLKIEDIDAAGVRLYVNVNNPIAKQLYEKCGYNYEGTAEFMEK